MDLAANFCYGTVTTAPSPAASGTSMAVTLLGGCTLPAAPFNCTVWLTGVGPLQSNAEIVRVTAVSMAGAVATLTIVRAQESTAARTIVVGDQFALTITAKLVSDIVTALAAKSATLNDTGAGESLIADAALAKIKKLIAGSNVTLTPGADGITFSVSAPGTGDVVGPAGATGGNFALFDGASGKLIEDAGISPADIAAAISAAEASAVASSLQKSANLSDVANAATSFGNIKQAATTTATGVVELATDGESAANIVPQANDSRLSNARTPTAHAASHITGGSDIIPSATTSAVGLAPAATAPSAGLLNVLGIANGETVRTDKPLFDTTNPEPAGVAAPGTSVIAARRDHVHPAQVNITGNAATVTTNANLTGPVTSVGNATTITDDAVTNAKLAEMLANTVKVNATSGTANPTDLAMAASTILARLASGDIVAATVAQLNALLQLDGLTTAAAGFRGIPQTSVSAARTVAAADNGTHWYHPSADTTARTWTIDSNANLALPIGFTLTFINDASAGIITIAITSDTLVLAGAGTTGSRSLAANGIATIIKMTSTRWQINGTGLT